MSTEKPRGYRLRNYGEFARVADELRTDRKITMTRLAELLGFNRSNLSRCLHGQSNVAAPRLWDIANSLGYDIALIPRQPEEQP